MKKYLIAAALVMSAIIMFLWRQNRAIREENGRLLHNNTVLHAGIDTYRTQLGRSVAQVGQLEMTVRELKGVNDQLQCRLEEMGLKLRRVESASINAIDTRFSFSVPLLQENIVLEKLRKGSFVWRDAWNRVEGSIGRDSIICTVEHRDTLDQVIYRVPRKFLFIRWGIKEIRQVVSARDPKSTIVYSKYIVLKRER